MKIIVITNAFPQVIKFIKDEEEIPFDNEKFTASQLVLSHTQYLQNEKQKRLRKEMTDTCQICYNNESTEQLPNESGLYVCYSCKIAQREVIP